MLAHRLTTILPAMTLPEALETTRSHRVAGRTGGHTALVATPLFRHGACDATATGSEDGEDAKPFEKSATRI
jgi:predicted ATPase with chaperone activity